MSFALKWNAKTILAGTWPDNAELYFSGLEGVLHGFINVHLKTKGLEKEDQKDGSVGKDRHSPHKPGGLSSIPGTHLKVKGENWLHRVVM